MDSQSSPIRPTDDGRPSRRCSMCLGGRPAGQRRLHWLRVSLVLLIVLVSLMGQQQQQQVEAAKKLKKAAKSIAKGLILSKLTSRKNFLPVPLPIPGKWQQVVNLMADSARFSAAAAAGGAAGGRRSGSSGAGTNRRGSGASRAGASKESGGPTKRASGLLMMIKPSMLISGNNDFVGKKLLLFGASNMVDTLASLDTASGGKLSAWSRLLGQAGFTQTSTQTPAGLDVQNVRKLTRLAAAKYAKRLVSHEASELNKRQPPPVKRASADFGPIGSALLKRSDLVEPELEASQRRNDALVTVFNVVKLAKQIRELEPQKLLRLRKKSSLLSSSTSSASASSAVKAVAAALGTHQHHSSRVPILSMNIDNRKTFLSKLHFLQWLTAELHHRHRHTKNTSNLFLS